YRKAAQEAETLRAETERLIARATPLVRALGTRAEAARAIGALARADSFLGARDFTFAKLAAQDAEQTAIGLGVAPPSPQPADARGVYAFVPRGGGVQREDRAHFTMRFTKLSIGWRLASVREARPPK